MVGGSYYGLWVRLAPLLPSAGRPYQQIAALAFAYPIVDEVGKGSLSSGIRRVRRACKERLG